MPGLNSGVNVNDPLVIAAFKSALLHQCLIALLIFAMLWLAWNTVRTWLPASQATGVNGEGRPPVPAEPAWRRLLRIGFGGLWILDGVLQAQPKMAIGLPLQVIKPVTASSPAWVQHVVNWAGTTWSYHPVQVAASAVWIQIGIGIWILAAARGPLSRLAGVASVGWGLVVWVFGESFGGIFAPGLSWLSGAPGAVLIYCLAGALIALPERGWHSPRLGRAVLAGLGLFLLGMAVLQAWPGRGFWQGTAHGQPGTLAGMAASMAQTPQPGFLASMVSAFAAFDQAHGFAVNLCAVAVLGAAGAIFLTGRPRLIRPGIWVFSLVCLADWVLIEDFGFFGGLGTDPNSMIPFALLAVAGYLALTLAPVPGAETTVPAPVAEPAVPSAVRVRPVESTPRPVALAGWRNRLRRSAPHDAGFGWAAAVGAFGLTRVRLAALRDASFRSVATLGALGLIVLGVGPMAVAQASRNADPILAQSVASAARLNNPASDFQLTDQRGRTVTLASLRGKLVLLTFIPVCTADCPAIAREFRAARQLLGAAARRVELVAVVTNPVAQRSAAAQAPGRPEYRDQLPNWLYLTGTVAQLRSVWYTYRIDRLLWPPSAMMPPVGDLTYVIDPSGRAREEFRTNPRPGTTASESSFAVLLANVARQYLSPP